MPRLALALCIFWFASLFVFRTVVQWRKTGSTGLKGFHGRIGSVPWLAGVSVALGVLFAVAAPLATLLHWPGGALFASSAPVHLAGALCVLTGTLGALLAQLAMGESWRVGVDETETTPLVTTGLFATVRNPIFSFMGLSLFGLVLLVPSPLSLLALALSGVGIELQVRSVEEPYLTATHGEQYTSYASRAGRFLPGVGRLTQRAGGLAHD